MKLWRRITFVLRKGLTKERATKLAKLGKTILAKGHSGLEQEYIDSPEAEAALKFADATSKLIDSLKGIENAVMRVGPILIVKVTERGKPRIAVETISTQLRRILNDNPHLIESPTQLFQELKKLKSPIRLLPLATEAELQSPS